MLQQMEVQQAAGLGILGENVDISGATATRDEQMDEMRGRGGEGVEEVWGRGVKEATCQQ